MRISCPRSLRTVIIALELSVSQLNQRDQSVSTLVDTIKEIPVLFLMKLLLQ